ncbi:MAG TPA: hypothetical protein VLK36_00295 [Gaiellaceae bacterium]|nr:hypothetical protein [Gaiellaceae bacterium]
MRIHTSIAVAIVTLALAGSAAAAISQDHSAAPDVVSSVYLGTSAVPGSCTMTLIAGHVSSFRCPGAARHAEAGSCTLTVAAGALWTYSCPGGKTGASKGLIPKSCKMFDESGFRWTFSCPRSAFGGSSSTKAIGGSSGPYIGTLTPQPTGHGGTSVVTSLPCAAAVIDGYISADRCAAS